MTLEIELKLGIAPGDIARLRRHPLLASVKPQRHKLYGIYFDTPDFDLYKRRSAFRLRREGYHWVQTVKLDRGSVGGLSMRPEFEVKVTSNQPDFDVLPPEALAALGPDIEASLAPVFVTDFQRTTWHLEQDDGVVEVALDVGHIRSGDRDEVVYEVELELKAGEGRLLFAVAERLLDAAHLVPEFRSKALRGYGLAGVWEDKPCKAETVKVGKAMPAAEAWRLSLLSGLEQLGRNLPGLLSEDDPEYVHQARVAVRRLLTLLGIGRVLGLEDADWCDELRWLMAELSPARDWDVLLTETLAEVCAGLPEPARLGALLERAQKKRQAARVRARQAVADQRLTRLLFAMGAALMVPRDGGLSVSEWAVGVLDKRLRRFCRRARGFASQDVAGRHQVRIAAKRLRYAGEAFSALHGRRAERFLAWVAEVQNGLGTVNDFAVAHTLLADLNRDGRVAYEVGLVEGFLAGRSTGHLDEVSGLIGKLLKTKPFWR